MSADHEIYFIVYRPTRASLMETEIAVGQERAILKARCIRSMHRMGELVAITNKLQFAPGDGLDLLRDAA